MIEWSRDPIYEETKEVLRRLKIEGVFLDLDDTLIYTAEIFVKCMWLYAEQVGEETGIGAEEILRILKEVNDAGYKKWGVSPEHWKNTLLEMSEIFDGHKEAILKNLPILMDVYETEPRVRKGAKLTLEVLRSSGVKLGLVTHANAEWTKFKLGRVGLQDYFDVIVVVDEKDHKKPEDWKKAMDVLEVDPSKSLVVGDNLGGDILPASSLGARTAWIPSPWSVYRVGTVPEDTVQMNDISDLLAALGRLR